jgi:two-component system, NtrC family, nitrogen regulation sensor histidine kinase NtrY
MFKVKPIIFLGISIICAFASVGLEYAKENSSDDSAQKISDNLQKEMEVHDDEARGILQDIEKTRWSSLAGAHFLIDGTSVIAWSQNEFLPDIRLLLDSVSIRLYQSSAGDFLVRKYPIDASQFLITVLPLYKKYPIQNKYLSPQWNKSVFTNFTGKIVRLDSPDGSEITLYGEPIFKIVSSENSPRQNSVSSLLAIVSLITIILALVIFLAARHKQKRYQFVFLVATIAFVAVRILMVQLNFPGRWYISRIFSPQEFASSAYNASLGDLFLNSLGILCLCTYAFLTYSKWPLIERLLKTTGLVRWVMSGLVLLMTIFSFLYPFLFIETLFHNSSISLDITQTLSFDTLRVLALLSVVIGTISAFLFTHIFFQLSKSLSTGFWQFVIALAGAILIFVAYFVFESRDYWITVVVVIPYLLILYFTTLSSSLGRISYVTFLYLFLTISAFGVQAAFSVKRFVEEERVESKFKFATSYLIGRDVFAEYLLNESIKRIASDAFVQSRFASPFLGKSPVRQKVKQVHLNSYFDRYDVQIHLVNALKEPYDDQTANSFAQLEETLATEENATGYKGIYYIRSTGVQAGKRYFTLIPVTRFDQIIGYIGLDLSLKRIIPQNVYPELLVDNRFNEYFENRDKSFAFISENRILSSFGNFNYEHDFDFSMLEDPEFYSKGVRKQGFIHAGLEDEAGKVAVVTSLVYPVFYVLTNFSFFFVLGIFALGFGLAIYGLMTWIKGDRINYAARIQLYIYLAFAVPLVIVTITTLNRVSKSAEAQLNQDFQNKSRLLGENFIPVLASYNQDPENLRAELESQLANVAKFANMDVTLYDPRGKIIVTSQPVVIESQLTSGIMNRHAWERIFEAGENSLVLNEKIGSLRFNNSYVGLKSPDSGSLIGVLSVPFFESALSLEATQISVLANIVTVFTIIFILFSLLSFFVVDTLTFPLRFITKTLSRTTLTGSNKLLEWKSNDEIGLMVTEYNRMVENLEQSKIELARSQKESAWREIAKQVAHEIKNPLTPMKLTLQQMEHAILRGELDQAKTDQSIKTLLTQVDILNEIASSFSAFARMPAPILQKIELVGLLRKCVDLYASDEDVTVSFQDIGSPLFVMGDDQLLNRIFSNIILNALQAREDKNIHVEISLQRELQSVVIGFHDNGKGIDQELKEKIFSPYFSTKKSGSGLGLAIAKQGIEQSGGEIWFESEPGKGTTFYIKLSLV